MSTSERGGKGRRERKDQPYHHGNLRAALIGAGAALLEEGGIAALSLREAAARAGVSRAAPYRHFADKTALLAAIAAEGYRGLAASMRAAAEGIDEPGRRMRMLGRGYVRFAVANGALFRLMFGPEIPEKSAHPELLTAAREAYGVLAGATTERLSGAGGKDAEAGAAAIAAWAMVHGLAMLLIDRQIRPEMLGEADARTGAVADQVTRFLDFEQPQSRA